MKTAPKFNKAELRRSELLIGAILRFGVLTSLGTMFIGAILGYLIHVDFATSSKTLEKLIGPDARFAHSVKDVFTQAIYLRSNAVLSLGLLILIATPVIRVVASIVTFVHQKDRKFTLLTSLVLGLLLLSFCLGRSLT